MPDLCYSISLSCRLYIVSFSRLSTPLHRINAYILCSLEKTSDRKIKGFFKYPWDKHFINANLSIEFSIKILSSNVFPLLVDYYTTTIHIYQHLYVSARDTKTFVRPALSVPLSLCINLLRFVDMRIGDFSVNILRFLLRLPISPKTSFNLAATHRKGFFFLSSSVSSLKHQKGGGRDRVERQKNLLWCICTINM